MEVDKKETKPFETPLGRAYVWGLADSLTKDDIGWHFMLPGEDGAENYFSAEGTVFCVAPVDPTVMMLDAEEIDPEKVKLLRELWAKYIEQTLVSQGQ
jgi:hypothetical protein